MSAAAFVEQLFRMPGDCRAGTTHLLAQAAAVHAKLLSSATMGECNGREDPRPALLGYLKGHAAAAEKRRLLDEPLLVEALHALAAASPTLARWDQAVAARPNINGAKEAAASGRAKLGNLALAVLLREHPLWCGEIELSTDGFGSLRFPSCDWSVWLFAGRNGARQSLSDETVVVTLDQHEARWHRTGADDAPFLVLGRGDLQRMVVDDDGLLDARRMRFPHPTVRPRLQFAAEIGTSGIHYEAVAAEELANQSAAHAGMTGAIIEALVEAMRHNAPAIYRQLCVYIRAIRGFELPAAKLGLLESFSTPLSPGVIGLNISYTADDEPILSPFCFTWLAHELGHTLHYLIDDAAWLHGEAFVANPSDTTPVVGRYGRTLAVRTLFQIPYVHLYEWVMLIDFFEARFRGLPWSVDDDAVAFGDDLREEILEAFDLILQHARLNTLGTAAIAHLRRLTGLVAARWRRVVTQHVA